MMACSNFPESVPCGSGKKYKKCCAAAIPDQPE
ncbi:MAG: SEC-C domain-containing protein [Candidatus Accumulibacter sp.]|uniref:SEC-C domain-containing protein n=1 Tax=Candidatus Accumulibacter affinis TaxID=2954384 RepID=A0A935T5T3_9PROT|nr:SEC-C domain-containing protein [Candidatus Accumulibacter affinis]